MWTEEKNNQMNRSKLKGETEPTTGGVLLKKVLLEASQNSQENTCARASFLIKLQAEACKISKNTFFTKHLWATLLFEKLSTKIFNHLTT